MSSDWQQKAKDAYRAAAECASKHGITAMRLLLLCQQQHRGVVLTTTALALLIFWVQISDLQTELAEEKAGRLVSTPCYPIRQP